MIDIPATPILGEVNNLHFKISNKFWKSKQELNSQNNSWQVKQLEERVEYLEFALREVITMLDKPEQQS